MSDDLPDAAAIALMLARCRQAWLERVFPNGKSEAGVFYLGNADGDPGRSLPVPLKANGHAHLVDFAGDFRGDDLDLFTRGSGHGTDLKAGIKAAAEYLGVSQRIENTQERPLIRIRRVSDNTGRPVGRPAGPRLPLGEETRRDTYYHPDRTPWFDVVRFDPPGAKKQFRQFVHAQQKWTGREGGTLPDPRPLFKLPELLDNQTKLVLVVAGEKCAEAGTSLGFLTTTNSGGEQAIEKTDWTSLKGRSVTLWRDNDTPGQQWQDKLTKILRSLDCSIKLVEIPPGQPESWDIADATPDEARRLVAEAPELLPPPPRFQPPVAFNACQLDHQVFWAIDEILPRCEMMMVFSRAGVGKTFLLTSLAIGLASGSWFGHEAEAGLVVYCAFERPDDAEDRLAALRDKLDLKRRNLSLVLLKLGGKKLNEETEAYIVEQTRLLAAQYRTVPRAIVLDTLSSALDGIEDEEGLKKLKDAGFRMNLATKAMIMWAHHEGKAEGMGGRGHTVFGDGCSVAWQIREHEDGSRTVYVDKANRGKSHTDLFAFQLVPFTAGYDQRGKAIELCEVQMVDLQGALDSPVATRAPKQPTTTTPPATRSESAGMGKRQRCFLRTLYKIYNDQQQVAVDRDEHRSLFLYEWTWELQKQGKEPLDGHKAIVCYTQTLSSLVGKRVAIEEDERLRPFDPADVVGSTNG